MRTTATVLILLHMGLLALLLFTDYSFIGYWTDFILLGIFTIVNLLICLAFGNRFRIEKKLKIQAISFSVISLLTIGFFTYNMWEEKSWNVETYKTKIENNTYRAYYKKEPFKRNDGIFWISHSPNLFPIIEKEVHSNMSFDKHEEYISNKENYIESVIE